MTVQDIITQLTTEGRRWEFCMGDIVAEPTDGSTAWTWYQFDAQGRLRA